MAGLGDLECSKYERANMQKTDVNVTAEDEIKNASNFLDLMMLSSNKASWMTPYIQMTIWIW